MTTDQTDDVYYAVAHRSQDEIDSFKSRYEDFDTSLIPKIFKQALGVEAKSWTRPYSWGSSHVIFFVVLKDGKRLVLRANLGFNKRPEVVMLVEKLITDKVAAADIPTNRVVYVDVSRKNFPFDFQIQEELVGKDIEDHFSGTREDYDKMSFELGQYIARLQDITLPGFGRFDGAAAERGELRGSKSNFFDYIIVQLDEDIEYLVRAEILTAAKAKKVRQLFDAHKDLINIKQGSLVHHDLADHNLMFKDNKITGLFDWEAAVVGDSVLDLASVPTWKLHYPREAELLQGYQSLLPLPDNFEAKMNIYRLRTILWKTTFVIRANILTPERKQRIHTALEPFKLA